MKTYTIKKGLDVPIKGEPKQEIKSGNPISRVALLGDDFIGMKPTMAVKEGDRVKTGQLLFTDKKNVGVKFTSPGCGTVEKINRGAKRKFESIIIALEGEDQITFDGIGNREPEDLESVQIKATLINSGLWCSIRTRPYGKIPSLSSNPASLFVTAMDTSPLAADPTIIIAHYREDFHLGLRLLQVMIEGPVFLCVKEKSKLDHPEMPDINWVQFHGPHPAGLPSTHIHFVDPVHEKKVVWHIGYHDVIAVGHLFRTDTLLTERIIALAGPALTAPSLITTRIGASLHEICEGEVETINHRILSGSILDGRRNIDYYDFLGFYHHQVSVLLEGSGRGLFGWAHPGGDRFSVRPAFTSALDRARKFAMNTALWGGKRAIYPLGTYDEVMPLDIVAIVFLKSLSSGNTEKARLLGCLELIEEDLALCSFVCPGKNNFGPMLRDVLTEIELEG